MSGTWKALSVCHYNLKYITTIRVIVVSAIGFNFAGLLMLPFIGSSGYATTLVSAFCAMLFYSVLTLLSMLISESKIVSFSIPVLWVFFWGTFPNFFNTYRICTLLTDIPITVSSIATAILLVIYITELRGFVLRGMRSAVYVV
jgi:hypothetical protein